MGEAVLTEPPTHRILTLPRWRALLISVSSASTARRAAANCAQSQRPQAPPGGCLRLRIRRLRSPVFRTSSRIASDSRLRTPHRWNLWAFVPVPTLRAVQTPPTMRAQSQRPQAPPGGCLQLRIRRLRKPVFRTPSRIASDPRSRTPHRWDLWAFFVAR